MKKSIVTIYSLVLIMSAAFGQGGTWTWVSGTNSVGSLGAFGTQGVPSVNNHPPGMYEASEWKDKQGNFWIYGGWTPDEYTDLWKFNPVTKEWTWVKGNGQIYNVAVYGTKGVPNLSNTPGPKTGAIPTWVDTSGNLWMFGGNYDQNDLWKYTIATNMWTWVSGSQFTGMSGVYGTKGVPSLANVPGGRSETSSSWTDSLNNLWLFGGSGYDIIGDNGLLNDLWKYNISTNEWTWVNGSEYIGASINYGIKGVANASNDPGSRETYTKWQDKKGNFWLMGGYYEDQYYLNEYFLNDVWKYDPAINEWTWMQGTNLQNNNGNYPGTCAANAVNEPGSRMEQRSAATDNCGRFWLFGGAYVDMNYYNYYYMNDLWLFDTQLSEWKLLNGSNVANRVGNWGVKGVPSASNYPASRWGAVSWWGNDNKFYMFGGSQDNIYNCYSDVWVFTPDTNCVTSCNSVSVPPPVADLLASKTALCANDCISYTDLSTGTPNSWLWTFAGGTPANSTDKNPSLVCYLLSGNYDVTLTVSNSGGSNTATFSKYINVLDAPVTPGIVQSHDTLFCSTDTSYISYQWYADTALIKGATGNYLVISKGGNYNISVYNRNGCGIAVGINTVGLHEFTGSNYISLFPNPANDMLIVKGNFLTRNSSINILDVLGQIVWTNPLLKEEGRSEAYINLKTLPPGVYFVNVINENGKWIGRFVKE